PSTGPCCLVRKQCCALTPRRTMDALGESVVMPHPIDQQIFNGDEIKSVHHATAVLVREITPSPGNAFMHPRRDLATLGAFGCTLLGFGQARLYLGQCMFLDAKEAWMSYGVSGREGGKVCESYVNANLLPRLRQGRWFYALTRNRDIPLAGAAAPDGGGLR